MKKKILLGIKLALKSPPMGRTSMGSDERFYDPYYMVGKCFKAKKIAAMSGRELENLLILATFAGDAFY